MVRNSGYYKVELKNGTIEIAFYYGSGHMQYWQTIGSPKKVTDNFFKSIGDFVNVDLLTVDGMIKK